MSEPDGALEVKMNIPPHFTGDSQRIKLFVPSHPTIRGHNQNEPIFLHSSAPAREEAAGWGVEGREAVLCGKAASVSGSRNTPPPIGASPQSLFLVSLEQGLPRRRRPPRAGKAETATSPRPRGPGGAPRPPPTPPVFLRRRGPPRLGARRPRPEPLRQRRGALSISRRQRRRGACVPGRGAGRVLQLAAKLAACRATPFSRLSRRPGARGSAPHRPPAPPPHPSSPASPPPPQPGSGSSRRAAEHGPALPGRRAPSHGSLALSEPAGPGAGRGEAPDSPRERVSPEPSAGPPFGGLRASPGCERTAPVPQGPGRWGSRPRPRGTGGSGMGLAGRSAPSLALRGPGAPGHDPTATKSRPGGAAALPLSTLRG